ncbi:MAG: hypothetical protein LBN21_01745, partial [Treponema sp.]|nr:hypothetical protein [Treponema sp.]
MNRKKLLIIGIAGGALVLLLVVGGIFLFRGKKDPSAGLASGNTALAGGAGENGEAFRRTIIDLARDYIEKGEYQLALDLLSRLNAGDDPELRELLDRASRGLSLAADNAAGAERDAANAAENTKDSQDAARRAAALAAAQSASRPPTPGEIAAREAREAERRRIQEEEQRRLEERALIAEKEAAAEAERKAAVEAEAARRRAQEEELARASEALQAQMRAVNDLVSQGKASLRKDDLAGAAAAFSDAR